MERIVYLDNAATTYPKPERVYRRVDYILREVGGNPGRGGHRKSIEAGRVVFEAREEVARFFNIPDSSRVVFTKNGTEALNIAIKGILKSGDHVITSTMEHNSVTRPLKGIERMGVEITYLPPDKEGRIRKKDVERAIRPETRMVILTHASNVIGTIIPVEEIGEVLRRRGILLLIDAAQTAGLIPIDVSSQSIDILAAPGHKGLFGPQGSGILYVREGIEVRPLIEGGTGVDSSKDEQPSVFPEALESGTLNTPAIGGLCEGIRFIREEGMERVRRKEMELMAYLLEGLKGIKGVRIYGSFRVEERAGLLSHSVEGMDPAEIGYILDSRYGIMVRTGLHCSPWSHRTLGTFPKGTIRVSLSYLNGEEDVECYLKAMEEICSSSV